jgi:hypothetical protein
MDGLEHVFAVARIVLVVSPIVDVNIDVWRCTGSGNRTGGAWALIQALSLEAPTDNLVERATTVPLEIAGTDVGVH